MNRSFSAIAGGVVGITAMSVLLLLLEVQTRSRIHLFDAVARFVGVPNNTFVGFLIFVAAGIIAWPLLFVALEGYIPGGPDPAARGVVFASVLWIAFLIVGRGSLGFSDPQILIYAAFTYIAHFAYGFFLGAVYNRLRGVSHADRNVTAT